MSGPLNGALNAEAVFRCRRKPIHPILRAMCESDVPCLSIIEPEAALTDREIKAQTGSHSGSNHDHLSTSQRPIMAPTAIAEIPSNVDLAELKAKTVNSRVELQVDPKPPVADNYMYDFKYNHALPTIELLGRDVPADVDAAKVALELTEQLAQYLGNGDAQGFTGMFLDYGASCESSVNILS